MALDLWSWSLVCHSISQASQIHFPPVFTAHKREGCFLGLLWEFNGSHAHEELRNSKHAVSVSHCSCSSALGSSTRYFTPWSLSFLLHGRLTVLSLKAAVKSKCYQGPRSLSAWGVNYYYYNYYYDHYFCCCYQTSFLLLLLFFLLLLLLAF